MFSNIFIGIVMLIPTAIMIVVIGQEISILESLKEKDEEFAIQAKMIDRYIAVLIIYSFIEIFIALAG
jgi:hypothetical protein